MPHERFFIDLPLLNNETIILDDLEFHHLTRVMRMEVGDEVELINGRSQIAIATIEKIGKREAELSISSLSETVKHSPKLILAQGIPRFNRLEYILEKATELDVSEFWLFPGRHSEKEDFSPNQQKRMEQITIAAMKQCGRLDLPKILLQPPLLEWRKPQGKLFFGDTQENAPYLWTLKERLPREQPAILVIGPEKGLDQKETAHLEQLEGCGVRLHHNILRTDTAPLVGLSLLQASFVSV